MSLDRLALVEELEAGMSERECATLGDARNAHRERALWKASRFMRSRSFESTEDVGAAVREHLRTAPEPDLDDLDPVDRAQELVYRSWEAGDRGQARALLDEALSFDPRCVDALGGIAVQDAKTPKARIKGLERAVAAGKAALGRAFFRENRGRFWGLVEARPYMHARWQLAWHLAENGRNREGLDHYLELLELDQNDRQGARYPAITLGLGLGKVDRALDVVDRFPDEESTFFLWARLLASLIRARYDEAAVLLGPARAKNRDVEGVLLDPATRGQEAPRAFAPGGYSEALVALAGLEWAWDCHSEALRWLADEHEKHMTTSRDEVLRNLEVQVGRPPPDWLAGLFTGDKELTNELAQRVEADEALALPWLLAVIEDDELHHDEFWEIARAPALAAGLVARLGLVEAAGHLVERHLELERSGDKLGCAAVALIDALITLGAPAVEVVLALLDDPPDGGGVDTHSSLYDVLVFGGPRDERIYRHLVRVLEADVILGMHHLVEYDDERAIGPLRAALARTPTRLPSNARGNPNVLELCRAIEDFGEPLTAAEAEKRDEVLRLYRPARGDVYHPDDPPFLEDPPEPVEAFVRKERPGRNDPCWCGSGKKYKRCHLQRDDAEGRA